MQKLFLSILIFSGIDSVATLGKTQSRGTDGRPADSVRIIRDNLQYPWEILWGKDDHIWMTERGGKISKIDPGNGSTVFSASIPEVVSNGEGGLLGMVQHPDFLNNGLFYVVYNYMDAGNYREKMVQMKYANGSIQLQNTLVLQIPASPIHNGSRLWISEGSDPKLFMTTGDASVQNNAQLTTSLSGKVLRFNLDGTIPSDNPIPGSPVWSFGHRNQQGLVMVNGILYASEHGPNIEDELNIIERNRNYGWPTVNGPCDQPAEISFCNTNNVKVPIWSSGSSTIAVCGLDYYNSSRIPAWQNSLLMLTLKDASLRVLKLSNDGLSVTNQQTLYKDRFGRLRDLCISPQGRVYICTSNGGNSDQLLEISRP
ncbi:MAG: PQQ-dependent sugar dehydrogenase [Chitinophagaceae bacterium]|nr:PQQ-dependent sugar dehydrogenase [Chitinophagaceae bacterium]